MKKILFTFPFIISLVGAQQDFVGDVFGKGSINFTDRTIQATGTGFIPENVINAGQARRSAVRIAKQDALRQLIEIVNGVNVTSETTIEGAMFDDKIKTQVQGAIRGARRVGDPRYLSDTSVEVVFEVSMNNIAYALLPIVEAATVVVGAATEASLSQTAAALSTTTSGGITGIIIDGKDLGLRPAMSPRILDQNGGVVYGPGHYSRDYAAANGVVGYAKSLKQAQADTRVQGNPLVLRATSASGTTRSDVIITNVDAGKVSRANNNAGVLKNCRIMFILD